MSRFKTELCNNLIELGNCKYGDRCHYAHGAHELRQVSRRHPKYRTERCKNFELTGKCPFGPRCSYVHPKPDLDSMIEQLTKYMKHTKAPKPDSDDDDDVSLFTRTNTSVSTCDSMIATNNDDENKENQINLVDHYNQILPANTGKHLNNYSKSFIDHHSSTFNNRAIGTIGQKPLRTAIANSSTPATTFLTTKTNIAVTPQEVTSTSSILRTPLGSTNGRNILTPMNLTNNYHFNNLSNQSLIQANDQIKNATTNTNTTSNTNNGTCSNNFSFFESTSHESNKKLRLISSNSSSSNNTTASNPFGISNPLSDYLNKTNIDGRSPLHPNKQLYTRF